MFKKPKRNFRGRRRDSGSDGENLQASGNTLDVLRADNSADVQMLEVKISKKKKDKDKSAKSSVLSFDHGEEEEGDDEFKVKRSSHSKKIAKQLKKDMQKEKEEKEKSDQVKSEVDKSTVNLYSSDNLKAMIKTQKDQNGTLDLNAPSHQSDEDSNGDGKFTKSSGNIDFLKSGMIPDAATIHAIRLKRQLAREQGDFIPLQDTLTEKSRLVREDDDNDKSEDEERINFTVDQRDAQIRHMQQTILQANEEDNSGSDHDWEEQQIRKGFHASGMTSSSAIASSGLPACTQVTDMELEDVGGNISSAAFRKMPPSQLPAVTMENITKRLRDSILETTSVHRVHVHERDDLCSRLGNTADAIEGSGSSKAQLEEHYRFFQEMRSYVQDLVDCLNHKMPAIEYLENSMFKLYQKHPEQFIKQRQQDIKDESSDALKMKGADAPPDQEKQHRIAEREARRARRKHKRDLLQIRDHEDGMSTDDDLKPSELSFYRTERERLTLESGRLFEDVVDDFCQFPVIMDHFEQWGRLHQESYEEAYIALCLPRLFTPLVRLHLISWNPLQKDCRDFEETPWFESLMFFGHTDNRRGNTDVKLIPSIIEKVLLPKLTAFVSSVWDPLSSQQTVRLVTVVRRLIRDYPSVTADSSNTKTLIKAIVDRMRKTLDDDVFMPLYPKPILEANKNAAKFFQRQFWQCVKLLGNQLKWSSIVADGPLQELSLDGLLNRYILLALQNSAVDAHSTYACQVIISTLPKEWFSSLSDSTIVGLQPLCRYLVNAAATLDTSTAGKSDLKKREAREQIKQLTKLLMQIHAVDVALTLANKYNVKVAQL